MRDIVRHVLAGMTADERVEAAEELRRMVAADRAAAAGSVEKVGVWCDPASGRPSP